MENERAGANGEGAPDFRDAYREAYEDTDEVLAIISELIDAIDLATHNHCTSSSQEDQAVIGIVHSLKRFNKDLLRTRTSEWDTIFKQEETA